MFKTSHCNYILIMTTKQTFTKKNMKKGRAGIKISSDADITLTHAFDICSC